MSIRFSNQSSLVVTAVSLLIGGSVLSQGFAMNPLKQRESSNQGKPKPVIKKSSQPGNLNASFSPAQQQPQQLGTTAPVSSFNPGGQDSKALEEEILNLKQLLQSSNSQLESVAQERDRFAKERDNLTDEVKKLSSKLTEQVDMYAELEGLLRKSTEEEKRLRSEHARFIQAAEKANDASERAKKVIESLELSLHDGQSLINHLKGQLSETQQENRRLNEEISRSTQEQEALMRQRVNGFFDNLIQGRETVIESIVTGKSLEALFVQNYEQHMQSNQQRWGHSSFSHFGQGQRPVPTSQSQRGDDEDDMIARSLSGVEQNSSMFKPHEKRGPQQRGLFSRADRGPQSHLSFDSADRDEELVKAQIRHDVISRALEESNSNSKLIQKLMQAMDLNLERDFPAPRREQTPSTPQSSRHVTGPGLDDLD